MKTRHIIRIFGLVLLMQFIEYSANAQDTVSEKAQSIGAKVLKSSSDAELLPYIAALENIDLDRYRLLDVRRVLKFESGVEIELLSGNELASDLGEPLRSNLTSEVDYIENPGVILQLHSSGRILEKHFQRAVK